MEYYAKGPKIGSCEWGWADNFGGVSCGYFHNIPFIPVLERPMEWKKKWKIHNPITLHYFQFLGCYMPTYQSFRSENRY